MSDIKERLDKVRALIQEPEFLEGKGLSNEVNIRIFCYEPENEMVVRHFVNQLETDQFLDCHLIVCNLYKTFLSICDDMDITDAIPDMEEADGSAYLLEQLNSAIGNGEFIDKIQYEPHEPGDVLMLTGVGEVFPFMRIHTLLEALQPYFSDVPLFFAVSVIFTLCQAVAGFICCTDTGIDIYTVQCVTQNSQCQVSLNVCMLRNCSAISFTDCCYSIAVCIITEGRNFVVFCPCIEH